MNAPGTTGAVAAGSADRIDALLPQTQCTRCGYPSCRAYAEALSAGLVDLNRCPPGGATTIAALARALGLEPRPLDPACGDERPWPVARIDEAACIGCTLCIQACPVDAILGAAKRMHTVLESECTGCELCLDPCPVDCIALENAKVADTFLQRWMHERAPLARRRFQARQQRLRRPSRTPEPTSPGMDEVERSRTPEPMKRATMPGRDADRGAKQAVIRAAVNRARRARQPLA
jgi:H+/Na+-translocating ferredoxin:NAD+ oxidoreductase subunit B